MFRNYLDRRTCVERFGTHKPWTTDVECDVLATNKASVVDCCYIGMHVASCSLIVRPCILHVYNLDQSTGSHVGAVATVARGNLIKLPCGKGT